MGIWVFIKWCILLVKVCFMYGVGVVFGKVFLLNKIKLIGLEIVLFI